MALTNNQQFQLPGVRMPNFMAGQENDSSIVGDVLDYGMDVLGNIPGDIAQIGAGLGQALFALAYFPGKAAYETILDPEGSLDYITGGEMWEDAKKNVLEPMGDYIMEYAHPLDKFRKDPLITLMDLNGIGALAQKGAGIVGRSLSMPALSRIGAAPSPASIVGRKMSNAVLNSKWADAIGINAWKEKLTIANEGRAIWEKWNTQTKFEQSKVLKEVSEEIGSKFTPEQTSLFHTAIKGLIDPDSIPDVGQLSEAVSAYKKLSASNRDLMLKAEIFDSASIFDRREMLPYMKIWESYMKDKPISSLVPEETITHARNIIRDISKDSRGGNATATKVLEMADRFADDGLGIMSDYMDDITVAYLRGKGVPSAYVADMRSGVINYNDFGIHKNLVVGDYAFQKKATGKLALNIIEDKKELLGMLGKHNMDVTRILSEKKFLDEFINHGIGTKTIAGEELVTLIKTPEDVMSSIAKQRYLISPGQNNVSRLAARASKEIITGMSAGYDVESSALNAINNLISNGDLGNVGLGSAKMLYSVDPTYAKSISSIAKKFARNSSAEKFFIGFVDPIHRGWKRVALGLNPKFALNSIADNTLRYMFTGELEGMGYYAQKGFRESIPDFLKMKDIKIADTEFMSAGKTGVLDSKPLGKIADLFQDTLVSRGINKLSTFLGKIEDKNFAMVTKVEDFYRESFYLGKATRLAKKDFMEGMGRSFLNNEEMLTHMGKMTKAGQFNHIAESVDKWFYNYNTSMTQFEKTWVRRVMPFWGFYRHSINLAANLPVDYPIRTALLTGMSKVVQDANEFEGVPKWVREGGMILGKSPFDKTKSLFLSNRGMNPFTMLSEVASIISPNITETTGTPLSMLSPLIKVPVERLLGRELYGSKRRFTSPYVYEDPFTDRLYKMDKHSGEIEEINRVSPPLIEHFMRQLPQYEMIKDMLYPYYRYGTSTIFNAEYTEPKKEKPLALTATRFLAPVTQIDKQRYAESFKKQMKRSQAALLNRLAATQSDTLIDVTIDPLREAMSNFGGF